MLPQATKTISQFIEAGKGVTVSYYNMSFNEILSNGTHVSTLNVISDYLTELRNACNEVTLSKEEQNAYFYKPKLLCYDIYGNPELYFIILLINDIADVKEFTKPTIKLLKKEYMNTLIGYIYNAEKDAMDKHNASWIG